ncbi:MAG: sialate O-acetylesterase [Alphaproteobacteria bacterium]
MLTTIGRAMRGHGSILASTFSQKAFAFLSTLPPEFTYTRNDTAATYRDLNGKWRASLANTPRFDHDIGGNPLGLRFEPPRTNIVNHDNFAPTTIGDIIVRTGDGYASVVADASVATATLDGSTFEDLQNGNVIALYGGTTGTTFRISNQTGEIGNVSFRVAVCPQGGGGWAGNIKESFGIGAVNFNDNGSVWVEIKNEDFTVGGEFSRLEQYVPAGKTTHIIGAQFERGSFVSTPIITTGIGGASRSREVCRVSDLTNTPWFNKSQGAMIVEGIFGDNIGFDNQYMFHAGTNGSLTDGLGMYSLIGSGQMRGRDVTGGWNKHDSDIHKPIPNKRFPAAITWRDNESSAVAGSMTYHHREYTGAHNDMDDLYIGGLPSSGSMCGWITSLTVYNTFRTLNQLAQVMFPDTGTYKAISNAGQSNAEGHHRSKETQENGGEIATVTQMDAVWTSSENWYLDTAIPGSSLVYANNSTNHWLVTIAGADGTSLANWKNTVEAFGKSKVQAIKWDQGAGDTGDTETEIYNHTKEVFDRMRVFLGADVPVFIAPISARSNSAANSYNKVKRAQEQLAADISWIHLMPPQNNITLGSDGAHLTNDSYADMAEIQARKMLSVLGESITGAVDAPEVLTATRSGTTITVPVTFPTGITAITPTSSISGFQFFDDGVEIDITAATYAVGDITLTLDSEPSGVEELYFGYGDMYTEIADVANFASGNDTYNLGIQNTVITPSVV